MTNNSGLTRFSGRAVRVLALTAVPAFLLVQSSVAQNAARVDRGGGGATSGPSDKDTRPYDKHDFTGLWARNPGPFKQPACPECRDRGPVAYGFFGEIPPRTPEGEKKFQMNRPTKGFDREAKRLEPTRTSTSLFAARLRRRCPTIRSSGASRWD